MNRPACVLALADTALLYFTKHASKRLSCCPNIGAATQRNANVTIWNEIDPHSRCELQERCQSASGLRGLLHEQQ